MAAAAVKRRPVGRVLLVLPLAAALGSSAVAVADDRPQWGARLSRNMASEEKGLPEGFDPRSGKNVKWSVPLGTQSYSTPVVAKGKVLIGTNNDAPRDPRHRGDRGVLLCLDERDGRLIWQLVVPKRGLEPQQDWPHTGLVSSPTVEGERVYLVTNRDEVACLDLGGLAGGNDGPFRDEGRHLAPEGGPVEEAGATDADIIWLYDLAGELGVYPHDAAHCSVLVHERYLYVATSNGVDGAHRRVPSPDAPSLVVLDKETGRLVARDGESIGPRIIHCTWSSPSLGVVGGRPLVFFTGGDGVCYGFEALGSSPPPGPPALLKRAFRFDCDPSAPKEDVHRFQDNRAEGPSNSSSMPVFHEGRVYVTAGGDYWHGKPKAWIKCLDPSTAGDAARSGEVWSFDLGRHCMSTPAVAGGLVFITDCGRKVHAIDAESGEEVWVHETKGEIWSSPLVADGKVYVGTQRGDFWVLAASREKRVLGSVELEGAVSASPVAANRTLYVATMDRLYAVANP